MKKNGFTLVELAIVTIILGILAVSAIPISTSFLRSARIKDTEQKLDVIETALEAYLIVNKRLPCPASLGERTSGKNLGDEEGSGSGCHEDSINDISGFERADGLVYGAVPTKTLGLSDSSMSDGWGNKILYVVDENFVTNFATTEYDSAVGIIQTGSSSSNIVTSNAIYILISHGENQHGAFPLYSNSQLSLSSLSEETTNEFNDNNSSLNETFVDYYYHEDFDDKVRFKTKMQMVMDIDWQDVGCAALTVGENYPIANYGEIKANTDVSTSCRKCYKYGRWGEEYACPE